jgi:hypothetical protein
VVRWNLHYGGSPILTNVDFIRNFGKAGGGIIKYSLAYINQCRFLWQQVIRRGAALYFMEVGTDSMVNVAFVGQKATDASTLFC